MKQTNRLSERFLLVTFSSHSWNGKHQDRSLGDEMAQDKNAEADAVEVIIRQVPRKELAPVDSARNACYRDFCRMTIPWFSRAQGLLATEDLMKFRDRMRKGRDNHQSALEVLVLRWPEITSTPQMKKRLGKLAGRYKLPTADQLRRHFAIELDMFPVPQVDGSLAKLANLSEDERAEIREDVEASMDGRMANAMKEVWRQLGKFIGKIAETMSEPNKKFRDSMFTKLQDFCNLLPRYNITNDPALEQVRKEALAKLASLDPDDLKEIPIKRKAAADEANKLIEKINQYIK